MVNSLYFYFLYPNIGSTKCTVCTSWRSCVCEMPAMSTTGQTHWVHSAFFALNDVDHTQKIHGGDTHQNKKWNYTTFGTDCPQDRARPQWVFLCWTVPRLLLSTVSKTVSHLSRTMQSRRWSFRLQSMLNRRSFWSWTGCEWKKNWWSTVTNCILRLRDSNNVLVAMDNKEIFLLVYMMKGWTRDGNQIALRSLIQSSTK